jgi:hypothetical protein
MNIAVRLVGVLGDQEEFADLIGTEGVLTERQPNFEGGGFTYFPFGRGDWLSMNVKFGLENQSQLRITTDLDNTFIFRKKG